MHFDSKKIQALNDEVKALKDRVYLEVLEIFPAATENSWSLDDIGVTILPDQPKDGLRIRIETPSPMPGRYKTRKSVHEVTIFADGTTDFRGMRFRPKIVAVCREKLVA
ncbi:MAG: hypothetical protein NVSMB39_2840 [Candidatus Saccharimonadales bacterium]